jgi:hypothetical protein
MASIMAVPQEYADYLNDKATAKYAARTHLLNPAQWRDEAHKCLSEVAAEENLSPQEKKPNYIMYTAPNSNGRFVFCVVNVDGAPIYNDSFEVIGFTPELS